MSAALQTAIFGALNVPAITGLLTAAWFPLPPIFDRVPQADEAESDTYFPYLTIGRDDFSDFSDKDQVGGSVMVQVHVWSRSSSSVQCKDIMAAIKSILVRQPLNLNGHITTEFESETSFLDPDNRTYHGVLMLRVLFLP